MPPAAFFSLPTRAWELAVGGLVALTVGQWRRSAATSGRDQRDGQGWP